VLGEIARQKEQWDDAIKHFRTATELDAGLADAFVGLGRSLLSAGHVDQAIAPMAQAEKLQPANPTTHYYSALALAKAGRKTDSDRAMALYKETSAKAQKQKDELNEGVVGRQTVDTPPPQP
jgi:tetratricopeptide (TPR) repeat protein